jgi:hypothetical protein
VSRALVLAFLLLAFFAEPTGAVAERPISVKAGDVVQVAGTDITCAVFGASSVAVRCGRARRARSYAVVVVTRGIWVENGRFHTTIFSRRY